MRGVPSSPSVLCSRHFRYHLKDVIVGKIYFLLVRIKIKHMELSIIRRETTGSPPNQYNESETITKFEIMDGAPVRGQSMCQIYPFAIVISIHCPYDRRDDSNPAVPGWFRLDTNIQGCEQEVQHPLLSQLSPHRRGKPALLQATGKCLVTFMPRVSSNHNIGNNYIQDT